MSNIKFKIITMLIIVLTMFNSSSMLIYATTEEIKNVQRTDNNIANDNELQYSEERISEKLKYKICNENFVIITGYTEIDEELIIPETIENYIVQEIGEKAFYNCTNLQRINLPEGITKIGWHAFAGCEKLQNITLPNSITELEGGIFYNCINLEKINYPTSLKTAGANSGYGIFEGCEKLRTIEIPEGATKIANKIFYKVKGIEEITLPNTVQEIGGEAFYNCTNLQRISLSEGITKIGWHAFAGCEKLQNITLPNSITELEGGIFYNCINLEKINYPTSLKTAGANSGYGIFEGCEKLRTIEIPEGATKIANKIFYKAKGIEEIILPNTIQEIEGAVFENCTNLQRINLPEGITKIGWHAFAGCEKLQNITLPNSITELEGGVFCNCINLEKVNYPASLKVDVTNSGYGIFEGCEKLRTIEIPEGVTKVPNAVFYKAGGIEEIILPNTVQEIGKETFQECNNLILVCDKFSKIYVDLINNGIRNFRFRTNEIKQNIAVLDHENSNYTTNFSSTAAGGRVAITCEYAIKAGKEKNAKSISIKIPYNAELISKSLYLNNKLCQGYQEDEDKKIITIPINEAKGKITFNIDIKESGGILSYALVNYELNGNKDYDIIGIINNQIDTVSINAVSTTNTNKIDISGIAGVEQNVQIYLENELIKTVKTNKVGRYNVSIELPNVSEGKIYNLKAKIVKNSKEIWASTKTKYSAKTPVMTSFKMNYIGKEYNLLGEIPPTVTFVSRKFHRETDYKITFEIKFTNPENVSSVYVTSDRNNITKRIKAKWNDERKAFITTEDFDEDVDYIPGKLSVYYTDINSMTETVENMEIKKEKYNELVDNTKTEILENTETASKIKINFKDNSTMDLETTQMTLEEGLVEVFGDDAYELIGNKRMARSSGLITEEMILEFFKKMDKKLFQDLAGNLYFREDKFEDNNEFAIYVVDTAKDTMKKMRFNKRMKQFTTDALEEIFGTRDEVAGGSVWSMLSGTYKTVEYTNNRNNELIAIKNSIATSNRTETEKAALYEQIAEYEKQLETMAYCKLVLEAVDAISTVLLLPPVTPLGIVLKASVFVVKDILMDLWEKDLEYNIKYLAGATDTPVSWAIDPSGYVYEVGTNKRLKGVKCELYYFDEKTGKAILWNAKEYNQQNPLYTDNLGQYAWDVPEGKWKVQYTLEGYKTVSSDWLDVPPPQTEVNIGLEPIIENPQPPKPDTENKYMLGDVNNDKKIDTKDARLVLLAYVGKTKLTDIQKQAADVNKDSKVDTKDARLILLYYVGKIKKF